MHHILLKNEVGAEYVVRLFMHMLTVSIQHYRTHDWGSFDGGMRQLSYFIHSVSWIWVYYFLTVASLEMD